ncbi:hypothetical protein NLG97_g579 [Lecanicillium saksenae]|uniref:Uncharacterized protein n=1 Tax=Lecanicillium saksenae TaxID=468837 RepID=A0ACC1R9N0_9HYPO|nr:hypothetical protein NLG97_g579 [Lecanicillium saksenae]
MAAVANGEQVYATLLLTDSYLPGALVLAHSLRDAGTSRKLVVFVTLDSVSAESITQLQAVFDHVIPVPRIRNEHRANLYLMNRPDLDSAFTKINIWKQTQFSKIIYIDADVVAYRAPDELFALQHAFGAAPDIGWPDIFNTGVMVLTPNLGDYYALLAMAERGISFDGADQGLLNMYFKNTVHRLSFTYNVTPSGHYQYLPAYRHFQSSISMVHFIGSNKPWFEGRHALHGGSAYGEMVGRWWAVYDRHYRVQKYEHTHSASIAEAGHQHHTASQPRPSTQEQRQAYGQMPYQDQTQAHGQPLPYRSPASLNPPPIILVATEATREQQQQQQQQHETTTGHSRNQSWDAQRQAPPRDSRPEAENFPNTHYTMSQDFKPFIPPARYPSPPKDMWYEVPKQRPAPSAEPPKAIFPWETKQPQASRSFPATPDEPQTVSKEEAKAKGSLNATPEVDPVPQKSSNVDFGPPTSIWSSFSLVNAWDDMPEISRYVERTRGHRRGKSSQISLQNATNEKVSEKSSNQKPNFQSLKLTDFPTEVERPSLPVTPAPIRRPSFWGEDADDAGNSDGAQVVPTAEGVPAQSEWVSPRIKKYFAI